MGRLNTFHLDPKLWPQSVGQSVTLDKAEARHMLKVLRTPAGAQVRLFDGDGRHGMFRLDHAGRNKAELIAESLHVCETPTDGLWLALGWGKSSRRGFLLEKAVELGACGIWFWQADFSQGRLPEEAKATWRDRCIQAAKQCGSVFLPEIQIVNGGIDALMQQRSRFDHAFLAWEKEDSGNLLGPDDFTLGKSLVVIGPEGGFSDIEAERLIGADMQPVSLGQSVLRWETAALHCLSLSFYTRSLRGGAK
ncbi:RsmE family RNA methyltransferase [Pseudodesulfovibrio senegalensis]|jgi:16S rRNA (uracil1498-N3)-methyltransferase|uniref:Ribosomal RNA small subunit methyltransferase E n=1 Tax=Pseudodesulfovibrio senegalensis TaxID=1721087 RepID=A0A6N6N6W5_9BACT|nr:RsmE family RNA methyltransferase [Pseudodesulfovibrio senegalensis]KAB1443814.1 16S rRNA (uracil(1498)-N(3))-methyltransferase [Pseudodesulfovibrio senegalensis]